MEEKGQNSHFVMVHGSCHGAWCWYKVKPRLESLGHKVTVLDLSASGLNRKTLDQVGSFREYSEPLLQFMSSIDEKVVLVGHSLGGMGIALASDNYPEKISVAVFLTALMPDTEHRPSYVLEQWQVRVPQLPSLDNEIGSFGSTEKPLASFLIGPKFLATYLYQLCSIDDISLATILTRPTPIFLEDLATTEKLSNEGYGSVKRVYIVCNDDMICVKDYQRWMAENGGVNEIMKINGADHMSMLSKPDELCQCLSEISNKYN
ncbi:salicylic acid-binding protein 2-like isoform X2 [Actinidia eriantha]|uniref:salicylic acid-binding protein 2-like isoform X2 n=1 Tax=Actinidia eriantha TaxID=165200 RepID=UPI00258A3A73|nr:salicylic acid-binding protein 2-like isoform X2 [Actinidia eriantha]